jgi:stage II sporulation protein D
MARWPKRVVSQRPRAPLARVAWTFVVLAALAAMMVSCARRPVRVDASANGEVAPARRAPSERDASLRMVRIALATRADVVTLTADGGWSLYAADGQTLLGMPRPGESWVLERDGARVSARRNDSRPVSLRDSPVIARPTEPDGTIAFNGRRYRGEVQVSAAGSGLLVVNRVRMDDYVKGVVPLEIGTGAPGDAAAVEAQAVAARSYAYMHLLGPSRPYDMVATVQDQVYGGVNAETRTGNQAVDATAGLVLFYNGRVVSAPYHANCGGSTAEPSDAWNSGPEPYLKRVSDQIPGTNRYYCDWAPNFRWTRSFTAEQLRQSVARYVKALPGGGGGIGRVRAVRVSEVTPAGRVGVLTIETDRGRWALRGNQIRSALRSPSGAMLYSTYFSVDAEAGREGVESLTLHGGGNGHGIGMCQTGAIGRARAGQDFRTILATYYPGTTVGTID